MTSTTMQGKKSSVSVKSVALPAEHGGWGFLTEPMIVGLLIAPSLAGMALCFAAAAVFLLHQPVKIAVKDQRRGRIYERTRLARRFVLLYGAVGAVAFGVALLTAAGSFWIPLILALPFAAVQLVYELRNEGRSLISEMTGALALAATAPAIILAGEGTPVIAFLAWLVLALRVVPSILYVRARLRLLRGKPTSKVPSLVAHGLSLIVSAVLWLSGLASGLLPLSVGVLFDRAVRGLMVSRNVPVRVIGIQELILGLLYAVLGAAALY